ncbi:conjugal transfer protein TrbF (plasmid) [Xylella fastidiosa]|uniref:Conjugal transfer protein n=1 Tax=Xylella fastidiosa (strain 9a5c) TaxID=160492 RepID=Q9PHG4_XYLFA|nr:conjugal transfer protein TrbF [Xylella fastidiosa]AAF85612.1 conjugal transfer protein [Xylella fastidiosa 9a5c]ALQ96021.1 conjugal transfer protein TrbF [Xylella fastidiosa]AWG45466.1 conjugal transfer protein TrbF [Xylella fastidiosa]KXB09955.1 conjugal transfer protein TrbF [Xylella fastidiosa]KXB10357.1 conjugal transfer protein TrbF [Xylella fastidiosa]
MSVNLRNPFGNKEKPDTNTANPYLNARRSWNSHVGQIMQHSQVGIFVGLLGMLIGLAAVGGMTYIGSQSKFIPLVFQQDGSGNTISMTRPDHIPEARVDDYRTAVSDFITNIRLVTPDAGLQHKAVLKTYGYLVPNDPATLKTKEYLNGTKETNPFNRAANEMVNVDVKSVLQQSKDTWQIDWQETVRGRDGSLKGAPYMMRALVTIYQNKDTEVKPEKMLINPHFIFVKDYNWSKQL